MRNTSVALNQYSHNIFIYETTGWHIYFNQAASRIPVTSYKSYPAKIAVLIKPVISRKAYSKHMPTYIALA